MLEKNVGLSSELPGVFTYRPELDGIRAIAVLAVVLVHTNLIGGGANLLGHNYGGISLGFSGGCFGVDIFFVLSGFLITTLLLQEHKTNGAIDFRAFYIRRFLRLAPAMVMVLSACSIYLWFNGGVVGKDAPIKFDWFSIAFAALYVSNFALIFWGLRLGVLTPTWSLSVEEQFYSVWPLIVSKYLAVVDKRLALKCVFIGALLVWLLRISFFLLYKIFAYVPFFGMANHFILCRADGLLLGACVAMLYAWNIFPDAVKHAMFYKILMFISAFAVIFVLRYGVTDDPYGWSTMAIMYAAISFATASLIISLLATGESIIKKGLRFPPLVYIGKISYGLYLYHVPIFGFTSIKLLGYTWGPIVALTLSFLLAALSYQFIERKFLQLRSKYGVPRAVKSQRSDIRLGREHVPL